MRISAFAFDYDGTLAADGRVAPSTVEALRALKKSGRKLLIVSGRELPDLIRVFPEHDLFDAIVVENGALLYLPPSKEERPLAPPPPPEFLAALRAEGVEPLSVGRSIVATWTPNETKVLHVIRELGLEWHIIFNKGAVMCLPPGVNKASGLAAALAALELSALNVVGAGDAENDHAFIAACGYGVAVANAIESLKAEADLVTEGARGQGVEELAARFLATSSLVPPQRHAIELGRKGNGEAVTISPDSAVLIAGGSGMGKSRLATALYERMQARGFQVCIIDPEGDYDALEKTLTLGDPKRAPTLDEAMEVLRKPASDLVVNLLGVDIADRPAFFAKFFGALRALHEASGRPHWTIVDEAHHFIPAVAGPGGALPADLGGVVMISAEPALLSPQALASINLLVLVGDKAHAALKAYAEAVGVPDVAAPTPGADEALVWDRKAGTPPFLVKAEPPSGEHKRHVRKYASGVLGEDKSFYFRGPKGALNLRAQNLTLFHQMAAGVDDETWLFHLAAGDYSHWLRVAIKDDELADEVKAIEGERLSANESRAAVREAIDRRYTAPADA